MTKIEYWKQSASWYTKQGCLKETSKRKLNTTRKNSIML